MDTITIKASTYISLVDRLGKLQQALTAICDELELSALQKDLNKKGSMIERALHAQYNYRTSNFHQVPIYHGPALSANDIKDMIKEAAELGAMKVLIESGNLTAYISRAQAYKMYGRGNVERWTIEGLVTQIKDGTNTSTIRIDRIQIAAVAAQANRASWFNNWVKDDL